MTDFVKRKITVQIDLGNGGAFEDGSSTTVALTGYRVNARIDQVVGPGTGVAEIRIFGLDKSLMAQLSDLNSAKTVQKNNFITLLAGDDDTGMAIVFMGTIRVGQQCLNTQPDTSLYIAANSGAMAAVQVVAPLSYTGTADVATILSSICATAHWGFENHGVNMKLQTPYLYGDPKRQIDQVCEAGRGIFEHTIDKGEPSSGNFQKLIIWPTGGSRDSLVPLISPSTGMVGYPNYSTSLIGMDIETIFNPHVVIGGLVQVQVAADCPLTNANGSWKVFSISHELDSETPDGRWHTKFYAAEP